MKTPLLRHQKLSAPRCQPPHLTFELSASRLRRGGANVRQSSLKCPSDSPLSQSHPPNHPSHRSRHDVPSKDVFQIILRKIPLIIPHAKSSAKSSSASFPALSRLQGHHEPPRLVLQVILRIIPVVITPAKTPVKSCTTSSLFITPPSKSSAKSCSTSSPHHAPSKRIRHIISRIISATLPAETAVTMVGRTSLVHDVGDRLMQDWGVSSSGMCVARALIRETMG